MARVWTSLLLPAGIASVQQQGATSSLWKLVISLHCKIPATVDASIAITTGQVLFLIVIEWVCNYTVHLVSSDIIHIFIVCILLATFETSIPVTLLSSLEIVQVLEQVQIIHYSNIC